MSSNFSFDKNGFDSVASNLSTNNVSKTNSTNAASLARSEDSSQATSNSSSSLSSHSKSNPNSSGQKSKQFSEYMDRQSSDSSKPENVKGSELRKEGVKVEQSSVNSSEQPQETGSSGVDDFETQNSLHGKSGLASSELTIDLDAPSDSVLLENTDVLGLTLSNTADKAIEESFDSVSTDLSNRENEVAVFVTDDIDVVLDSSLTSKDLVASYSENKILDSSLGPNPNFENRNRIAAELQQHKSIDTSLNDTIDIVEKNTPVLSPISLLAKRFGLDANKIADEIKGTDGIKSDKYEKLDIELGVELGVEIKTSDQNTRPKTYMETNLVSDNELINTGHLNSSKTKVSEQSDVNNNWAGSKTTVIDSKIEVTKDAVKIPSELNISADKGVYQSITATENVQEFSVKPNIEELKVPSAGSHSEEVKRPASISLASKNQINTEGEKLSDTEFDVDFSNARKGTRSNSSGETELTTSNLSEHRMSQKAIASDKALDTKLSQMGQILVNVEGKSESAVLKESTYFDPLAASKNSASPMFKTQLESMQNSVGAASRANLPIQVSFGQPAWAGAIAERSAMMASQKIEMAEIQLDPPELGPLQVRVQVQHDQASVSFVSGSVQVRESLEQASLRLKEMLGEQGLNLVDVDVSDRQNQASSDQNEDTLSNNHQRDEDGVDKPESFLGADASQQIINMDISTGIDQFV